MNTMIHRLKETAVRRSAYWRTVREIENMPEDAADDLGISRYNARRIAHQAVYG